jgi:hypothetical protein
MTRIRMREVVHEKLQIEDQARDDAEAIARSMIFTHQRNGVFSQVSNVAKGMRHTLDRGTGGWLGTMLLTPIIPFTTIVGNLADTMTDFTPVLGVSSANGISIADALGFGARAMGSKRVISGRMSERTVKDGYGWLKNRLAVASTDPKYYEQMGRAWTGFLSVIAGGMMMSNNRNQGFYVTADDDNTDPNCLLYDGKRILQYTHYPMISGAAAMLGYWSSYARRFPEDKDDVAGRMFYSLMSAATISGQSSVAEGMVNLLDLTSKLPKVLEGNQMPWQDKKPGDAILEVGKGFLGSQLSFYAKTMPQSNNMLVQTAAIFDPTRYSKRDVTESLWYALSGFTYALTPGKVEQVDVFGNVLKRVPGSDVVGFLDNYVDDISKRPGVAFCNERGIIFGPMRNRSVDIPDDDALLGVTVDKMNSEEFGWFAKKSGEIFTSMMSEYMSSGAWKEEDDLYDLYYKKKMSMTEISVRKMQSASMKYAKGLTIEQFPRLTGED